MFVVKCQDGVVIARIFAGTRSDAVKRWRDFLEKTKDKRHRYYEMKEGSWSVRKDAGEYYGEFVQADRLLFVREEIMA